MPDRPLDVPAFFTADKEQEQPGTTPGSAGAVESSVCVLQPNDLNLDPTFNVTIATPAEVVTTIPFKLAFSCP